MKLRIFIFLSLILGFSFVARAQNDALWSAIKACDPVQVANAIEKGADIHARDAKERTALLAAAAGEGLFQVPERQKKIVSLLLDAGADVNAQDAQGFSPLHYAAFHGNADLAELLIEKRATVDMLCYAKQSPLLVAARYPPLNEDRKQTIALLLENGANASQKDEAGRTAVHLLCAHKTKSESPLAVDVLIMEICALLQAKGASVTLEDANSYSPFAYAVQEGHGQTTFWLLDKGASARSTVLGNYNAIHFATERGQIALVDRLVKAGLDLNAITNDKHQADGKGYFFPKGSTALDIALISEYETKDNFVKKEWKGLANALKQRGAISRTFKEYVKGFNVMQGPKGGGGSKIGR